MHKTIDFKSYINEIPDFPLKGILFRDMSPLLANPEMFNAALDELCRQIDLNQIDAFAGIESRGFILASALAARTRKGIVLIRKTGKLPPPTVRQSYALEYGTAEIELRQGQGRVVLVDDVLATGGTLTAAVKLCERAGYEIKDVAVLINLLDLNQWKFNDQTPKSLMTYL